MKFAIIDLETTGGNPSSSRIIEVAIYISDGYQIIDKFDSLVNPETEISEFIENFTGIKNEIAKSAPVFSEIAQQIFDITNDCIFVAHNVSFDYKMLRHEFRKLNIDYRREQLCTIQTSRKYIEEAPSFSLGKLTKFLGIKLKNRHRATGDALATVELFHLLFKKSNGEIVNNITSEFNLKKLNPNLQIDSLEDYPTKKGIVKYYNETNQILYVVYSENIYNNLKKVITQPKSIKNRNLLSEFTRVEYEIMESEILGQITVFDLKMKYKPKYNRISKKGEFAYGIFNDGDKNYVKQILSDHSIPSFELRNKIEVNKFLKKFNLNTETYSFSSNVKFNKKMDIFQKKCFLIQKGKYKNERTIFWIDKGELIGYGYVPAHVLKIKNKNSLLKYIDYKAQNGTASSIVLNQYLLEDIESITF